MAFFSRTVAFRSIAVKVSERCFSRSFTTGSKFPGSKTTWKTTAVFGAVSIAGLAGFHYYGKDRKTTDILQKIASVVSFPVVKSEEAKSKRPCGRPCGSKQKEETCLECQPNITSPMKLFTLFLWITLEPTADPCAVANAAVRIDDAIKGAEDPCGCNEEILAGVGFGPNFLAQSLGPSCKPFCYRHRKGKNGEMPSCDGDIFVHAKSDSLGRLFDFCKHYMHCFPEDSVLEFEDIYGFDYRNGRDISGFMDNATNRCKPEGLKEVAVECTSGGSYALAQKWVHDFCVVDNDPSVLEKYIGREMISGKELASKAISSHVARMNGSTDVDATPQQEIVRQSQSYGSFSEKAGNFFLGFASDPCAFEFMLDRMVGAGCDGEHDDLMKMSKNVKGAYFYFPGVKELDSLRQ